MVEYETKRLKTTLHHTLYLSWFGGNGRNYLEYSMLTSRSTERSTARLFRGRPSLARSQTCQHHTPVPVHRRWPLRSPIKYYRTQNHSVFKINWKVKTCRHQRKSYVQSWIRLWMQFSFTTATIVDSHWLNIVERDIFKESIKGIRWTVLVGHTSTDTRIMPRFIGLHQFDTLFKRNHPELLSIWKVCLLNQYYN